MSLKHWINIRSLLSQSVLFDSRHATSSSPYLQGQRTFLFCFVAWISSITSDKAFRLGLCSVVGSLAGWLIFGCWFHAQLCLATLCLNFEKVLLAE